MAIGRTLEEAFMKAKRSIDTDVRTHTSQSEIRMILSRPTDERFHCLFDAFRQGFSVDEISHLTSIVPFFLEKIRNIVDLEKRLAAGSKDEDIFLAKTYGFTNTEISALTGKGTDMIEEFVGAPVYKMVDTCAAEFPACTPYFYSTWEATSEIVPDKKQKILILGSGPIRIGQGIEFDYCTVHAVKALREEGVEVHIVNNNPETVSTDFDTSDRLFFEPMQLEDVANILMTDEYYGVMVQFGGQNAVNLAVPLEKEIKRRHLPTKILGTTPDAMDIAEDRDRFSMLLNTQKIPSPANSSAYSEAEAREKAEKMGYPVLVRPSYVLGGRAMEIVHDTVELETYMKEAGPGKPASPGTDRLVPQKCCRASISMQYVMAKRCLLEGSWNTSSRPVSIQAILHASYLPSLSRLISLQRSGNTPKELPSGLGVVGLVNIQMAVKDNVVYILEANPRASRTVPFVSKATGLPIAKIAAKVMIGKKLRDLGSIERKIDHVAVKEVLLPFNKLAGVDTILGPE